MSAAQHTPGPWEVDLCDNGAFAVYVPPAVDMGWTTVITSRGQLPDRAAESHANARLITAAPELLEALMRLLSENDKMTQRINLLGACEQARAAIAKATGQQGGAA